MKNLKKVRKIVAFAFALFIALPSVFAQSNSGVRLNDEVYEILKKAENQGLCTELFTIKPYTQNYIVSKLEEIKANLEEVKKLSGKEKDYIIDTELEVINEYIKKYEPKESSLKDLRSVMHSDKDGLNLTFGATGSLEGFVSGGIYTEKDLSSAGFEEWQTLNFFGDFGKHVSFDWFGGIDFTSMPLKEMNGIYHIGSWWNETGGYDKNTKEDIAAGKDFTNRFIHTYRNYSVLPYSYVKNWDGSVYHLDNFNAGGLEGWPNRLSFGMTMQGGIEASFFNDRLYVGISRKNREWGGMTNGASLALNANARPFLAMEASFKLFDWLSFGALTGFLEFPNNEDVRNAWYIPDANGKHQSIIPSARDSYFFQDMFAINIMNVDLKYFHFDFGSTCIFPKRFELGYMFPLFEKIVFQNNIGDYDNLGLFGSLKGRLPGLGSIWVSGFVDEINAPDIKRLFNATRCMFAYQAGLETIFPILPFGKLSFRYTKIEPYCYTHTAVKMPYYANYVASSYINNGAPLGYYLEPNSDEFFFRIDATPIKNLDVGFQYQLIRHGATWGPKSVEGSSIYSELEPHGRDNHRKYFLKDGVYEWSNILALEAAYDLRPHGLPMKFNVSAGYVYNFFTQSGEKNTPKPISSIEKDDPLYSTYPITNGAVLSMGFKFFTF